MSGQSIIVLVLGFLFLAVGLVMILSGVAEERGYYNALSRKRDLREFVTHNPERPEPGSLRIGGWISIGVGLLILGLWVWLH
ncbi:hypothetical protein [Dehalogenimonas etheniformans]|uniref:DUF3784 domain-containing protein n=1 Tax=Dehalogenimonas etheniformans TaxID=1536648 RepID=A0A2P5P8T9_9CHLR|nr:hypothetical protein [Dehalogenimonas etheniformans]PPD58711.1 hypothetical protein JP09_002225 [Dehalogenimonas etheniformans]QNT76522.1 hypothetical protein HX448_07410 [Dehalogenimonas etheniformans]